MPLRIKKINMSWGSPDFLAYYWKDINFDYEHLDLKYHNGSSDDLKSLIKVLHKEIGNANTNGKYIVVGHGASQILMGLMSILGDSVFALAPHFSRFPVLAGLAGVPWGEGRQIITLPNNPDNSTCRYYPKDAIYDLSYNWPQYTRIKPMDEDIMVYSLSKATGHASTRIGWAILSDKKLAGALTKYIEISTGGLSLEAQHKAINVIKHQLLTESTVFDYGKSILKSRWNKINKLNLPFDVINDSGMFMWCHGDIPTNLKGIKGNQFGCSKKFFRLNLGVSKKTFDKFLRLYDKG